MVRRFKGLLYVFVAMCILSCGPSDSSELIDLSEYDMPSRISVPNGSSSYYVGQDSLALFDSSSVEFSLYAEMNSDSALEKSYFSRPLDIVKKTRYYVFHCTASAEGVDLGVDWFLSFFKNDMGWSRPGYSMLLTLDGVWREMYPNNWDGYTSFQEMTYGVRGINSESMHFAYVGGVDKDLNPKNTLDEKMRQAMRYMILYIKHVDPDAEIIFGHRDAPGVSKACPSFDLRKEFEDVL